MRRTRIQAAVGTIAIAAAVGGSLAVRADGQAGPPSGTLEFDVVADASSDGGTNPSGAKAGKYPRIAEVNAANAKIVIGGKTVGRWDNWQVVTDRGNGRAGGDMRLIVQALVTIGGDTIALGPAPVTSDLSGTIVGPIMGGTGKYAGAEGTASGRVTENSRERFVQHLTLTFVP